MGLSIVCIAVGTLESLVNAFSFIAWTVFLGTFLSIYVLQRKEPHLKRPFKVWAWLPACMALVSIALIVIPLIQHPQYFLILLLNIPGTMIYFLLVKSKGTCLSVRKLNNVMTEVLKHWLNVEEES